VSTAPYGFLRVGAACPRVTVADPARNGAEILRMIDLARQRGVQLLVFPELSLTGYTAGDLFFSLETLVGGAERALSRLLRETADLSMTLAVGLPVSTAGRLFNCAVLAQQGEIKGVVPKTYLPGYKEYYEERWFSSGREATSSEARLAGGSVPFGTDLLFTVEDDPQVTIAIEICEDLWTPAPPSSLHAMAGATLVLNPSASNALVAKAEYRRELVRVQSGRGLCAYAYANCGVHESTTDLVFDGQLLIAENGTLLAEGERFTRGGELVLTDVDLEWLRVERARQGTFLDGSSLLPRTYRRLALAPIPAPEPHRLVRRVDPHPFVPRDPRTREERCQEIFSMQTSALAKRLEHTGIPRAVLGLSGGLDSTLALLVTVRAFDLMRRPRGGVLAVTMPGFGTTERTLSNARELASALGVELREIDIRPACSQHIRDIGLDPADLKSATYQNLQARERTQVLMDLANLESGLVVGTGDLSELALGFSTFAGDHIAMYNVNAGVPKTLVRDLVSWVAGHETTGAEATVLRSILDTPVSPELIPPEADGSIAQKSEDIVGPYELHDFFLFAFVRLGAGPRKALFLAEHAFADRYPPEALQSWLRMFITRFFEQQFKRSVMPDGPKVGSVSLSPRGDWRMPSDASKAAWLKELDAACAERATRLEAVAGKQSD
jgi:NAD+ synthase (glutamine-hydrolysing)